MRRLFGKGARLIGYFLVYLSLHSLDDREGKFDKEADFKVCDFACGSGTLLSASYAALQTLYRKTCFDGEDKPDLISFHKNVLENSIWGFDALEHAAQTASGVLSLHEAGVPLRKMRIFHDKLVINFLVE